ncbi:R3H domain-containing protein [Dirofilaria immitis]
MGVLRRNSRLLMTNFVTLDDYLIDDESEVETQPENDASEAIAANSTPNRRRQKDARNIKKAQWLSDMAGDLKMKKGRIGTRKQRRYENAQLLYSTVNAEDICEDYSDILQSTVTALSKLFIEEENMQAWNTFIEKNEEEQREFLKSFEAGKVRQHCSYCDDSPPEGVDVFEHQACNGHPSYSAEVSFSRLNRRFRMILRHKALPMEFMAVNEKEMRKFFHKNVLPVSEWSSSVLPRLQRIAIHALSQYLSLISKSVVIGNGDEKLVKVRNKYYSFRPPSETLVDYLKRMHGANNAGKNLS